MLDLETFSTDAGGSILSIGACKFDPMVLGVTDKFHVAIDPVSGEDFGLKMSASTVMWWLDNARHDARQQLLSHKRIDLASALEGFALWFGPHSLPTWGNGVRMDNAMLEAAYKVAGMECPWQFYDERCYRTVKNLAPQINLERVGVHHDALDDAISQAVHLQQIVAKLGIVL